MSTPFTQRTTCSRRRALAIAGATGISLATSCTPIRFLINDAPAPFRRDKDVTEPVLRLFVETVVPGIPIDQPGAATVFLDPAYPLTPHRAWLAADLCARADRWFSTPFDGLPRRDRTTIVREGLAAGGISTRIYTGAVFLAQIGVYGGLTNPHGACPLIGFEGPAGLRPPSAQTYPDPWRFLAIPLTRAGNPD